MGCRLDGRAIWRLLIPPDTEEEEPGEGTLWVIFAFICLPYSISKSSKLYNSGPGHFDNKSADKLQGQLGKTKVLCFKYMAHGLGHNRDDVPSKTRSQH